MSLRSLQSLHAEAGAISDAALAREDAAWAAFVACPTAETQSAFRAAHAVHLIAQDVRQQLAASLDRALARASVHDLLAVRVQAA